MVSGHIQALFEAPHLVIYSGTKELLMEREWTGGRPVLGELVDVLLHWIGGYLGNQELAAVGHRVVHGGPKFKEPVLLSDSMVEQLDSLVSLAPLHEPHNIAAIKAIKKYKPDLPQVACFDTAFHHGHGSVIDQYGLPGELTAQGIKKYGFHGLSYEYIAGVLQEKFPGAAKGRTIVAHLGNGASLCAMQNGKSIDSTMGFTTLDGLLMGTRCGSIDPGVILFLQKERGMSCKEVERLLYHESGLLGVSGISSDVRVLLSSQNPNARQAIDLFVHRIVSKIGELMMQLSGVDTIVFTAGIGEHQPVIRQIVCERLAWLGLSIDQAANEKNHPCVHSAHSRIQVLVIPTDEELMIARHTLQAMKDPQGY